MASAVWSNRFRRDPMSFLTGREICPGPRQSDQFLRQRVALSQDLHSKDLVGHFGCVNAIEFSHGGGQFLASGGDDRRVLIWNVEKSLSDLGKPAVLRGEHNSNIFCVAFDIDNTSIFSGGNDEQVIVHDIQTEETKDVFQHEDAVYGISPDPSNPHVFASACGDGRVLIYDVRESTAEPFCLANYTSSMHAVMYNPMEPRLLATANAKEGLGLWDVRKPRSCVLRYGGSFVQQSCMSIRFNQRGDQLIALRRRLPPVLYRVHSNEPVCEFDHSGYYNSCTMKSICYAGDNDQYILSGSDEFNLYMWAVPEDLSERQYINSAHMVLKGHRSIVNQVRFNVDNHLIVSSGVEKIIKVWSPFRLPSQTDTTTKNVFRERPVYSHEEYINLVLQDGHVMSHDYSHESTEEDPRMMAFFDSLVQRELEGWSSDDSLSSNEEELYSRIVQMSQSDIDSDDSLTQPVWRQSEDEPNFSPFSIAFASVMASQAAGGSSRFPRLNAALERAEISLISNEDARDSSSESDSETNDASPRERAGTSASIPKRNIAKLVQKKKTDLKQTAQRHRKDCEAKVSSSSSSDLSDVSEGSESDEDTADLNIVIGERQDLKAGKGHLSQATREGLKVENENKKQTLQRLKKLRTLRENIMQENDTKELDTKSDAVTDAAVASTSTSSPREENSTAVQFKTFKRKHSSSKLADRRDRKKSRDSPDQGPYLQKNMTASIHDVHQAPRDETISNDKEIYREYSSDSKGKHRSILDYRHKHDTGSSSQSRNEKVIAHCSRYDMHEHDRGRERHKKHTEYSYKHKNDIDESDTALKAGSKYSKIKHKAETVGSFSGKECSLNIKSDKYSKYTGDRKCDTQVETEKIISIRSPGEEEIVYTSTGDDHKIHTGNDDSNTEDGYTKDANEGLKLSDKVLKFDYSQDSGDQIISKKSDRTADNRKYLRISGVDSDAETSRDCYSKIKMQTSKHREILASEADDKDMNINEDVESSMSKSICDICGISMKPHSIHQRKRDFSSDDELDISLCRHCQVTMKVQNEQNDSLKSPEPVTDSYNKEFDKLSHSSNRWTKTENGKDSDRNTDKAIKHSCSYSPDTGMISTDIQIHDVISKKSKTIESEQKSVVGTEDSECRSRRDYTARQELDEDNSSKLQHGTDNSSRSKHKRSPEFDSSKHHHTHDHKSTKYDTSSSRHHSGSKHHGIASSSGSKGNDDDLSWSNSGGSKHGSTKSSDSKHRDDLTRTKHSGSKHQSSDRHGSQRRSSDSSEHRHCDRSNTKTENDNNVSKHHRDDSSASKRHSSGSKRHDGSSRSKRYSTDGSGSLQYRRHSVTSRRDSDEQNDPEHHCSGKYRSKHDSSESNPGNNSESKNSSKQQSRHHSGSKHHRHDESESSCDASNKMESRDDVRSSRKDSCDGSYNVRSRRTHSSDSSGDDAQPTWTEFKRFKNKLERARKHYKKHKHRRDSSD